MLTRVSQLIRAGVATLAFAFVSAACAAPDISAAQVQELIEQNRRLQEQVRTQQKTIDELLKASERHERELRGLADRGEGPNAGPTAPRSNREHEVRISAEAGIAFFNTGSEGQFPKAEFRIDDPVIALEAPVRKNVYFYSELKLLTRETNTEDFQLGEIYVDFEDVSAAWGQPGLLNLRAGRLNIPFGEEYLVRTPVANPLISHSLADIWGVDEGIEIYGRIGPAQYIVAVQNGGASRLRDFNADKAVTARVSWTPARWLQISGSAMRTGELATIADNLSEVWFANAFFRAIGPVTRTGAYWANLYEIDATARWKGGHLGAAIGRVRYDDSDPVADNARNLRHGHIEIVQEISGGFYGAARYSEIRVPNGYPLAGWGPLGTFFFRPIMTEQLRRTSVGLGYRFGPPLVLKVEYAWETGRTTTGARRDKEDFFGTELGVKF
jgi:hypothetical protein